MNLVLGLFRKKRNNPVILILLLPHEPLEEIEAHKQRMPARLKSHRTPLAVIVRVTSSYQDPFFIRSLAAFATSSLGLEPDLSRLEYQPYITRDGVPGTAVWVHVVARNKHS